MKDDIEHLAFARRPRDARAGPFRMPDARTLGMRLAALRQRCGLSVADVADAAGLRHSTVEEFEEYGAVSGETLLWLVEILCDDDRMAGAFLDPPYRDRQGFLVHTSATDNVLLFPGPAAGFQEG